MASSSARKASLAAMVSRVRSPPCSALVPAPCFVVFVTVGPRARLGAVGPNGVGKTTLLRLLARLDRPDRGSVTRTPPNARVGYLPQEPERSAHETLLDFL